VILGYLLPLPVIVSLGLSSCGGGVVHSEGASGGGGAAEPAPAEARLEPLNVLWIVVDDLNVDLGCYGAAHAVTPHIDAFAEGAVRFERAYCQQAICHPSRTSFLTGCRPETLGVHDLRTDFRRERPELVTLPQLFREAGWRTLALGKIHHGSGSLDDSASWSERCWRPVIRSQYHTEESHRLQAERAALLEELGYEGVARGPAWEAAPVADDELHDGKVAARALALLEEHAQARARGAGDPLFLAVGFKKPHLPLVAPLDCFEAHALEGFSAPLRSSPPEGAPAWSPSTNSELRSFAGMPREGPVPAEDARQLRRAYAACVTYVDRLVGGLLDALGRLELAEDTVVVVTSDHGFHLGELGQWGKHTNFERGTRVPLLVRVPARRGLDLAAGQAAAGLVELVDLYPTLAELCGLAAPSTVEGTSLVPLLVEPGREWKQAAFSLYPRGRAGKPLMGRTLRTPERRYTLWGAPRAPLGVELYEYGADDLEGANLSGTEGLTEVEAGLRELALGGWRRALPRDVDVEPLEQTDGR